MENGGRVVEWVARLQGVVCGINEDKTIGMMMRLRWIVYIRVFHC